MKFLAESHKFNVKKVSIFLYLGPYPKRPLMVHIIHLKTRIVSPFACPCNKLPMNRRFDMIAGRFRYILCFHDEYDYVCVVEII